MALKQSEILGLFTSPRDIQALQRDRVSQEAQMYDDPIARQMYMSSAGLAGGLGQAFGANIQGQAEASQIEKIRKEVPFDVDNQSAYYTQLAQRLINQGLTQAGAQALELAKKARLDESKITKAELDKSKLSVNAEKQITKSNDAYMESITTANKAAELASEFSRKRANPLSSGYAAIMGESWKEAFGNQDDVTSLRNSYTSLSTSKALNNLPPGAASDTDVALVLRPFPKDTADPDYIANFLAGMAKGEMINAEFHKFRANYIAENGNEGKLIQAWGDYYKTLDLESLFAQQGFSLKTQSGGATTQQPQAVSWGSL